ncbi:hypothetical protein ACQKIE_18545 [Luteibacter sp. NPDC031894]|uniref:hypothetical protein n=1 Tax=Luteibacter sp. NPDC031894 TaxID=3390572 RepID=UPI003D05ABA0
MKQLIKFAFALVACCFFNAAIAQYAPDTLQTQGSVPLTIKKVSGTENVYRDDAGNAYEVNVQPLNSTSCDSGGCTVKVCQGGADTSPCVFYRCTTTGGCVRLSQSS